MTAMQDLPIYMTVQEVATLLRTSTKAIYASIARQQLPGVVRLGRKVLVRTELLLRALERSGNQTV